MTALASKVLVTGRRFHFDRMLGVASSMYPEAKVELWSDERLGGDKVFWWGRHFYGAYRSVIRGAKSPLTAEELDDVITRCRFSRELPRDRAEMMAHAGFLAWTAILEDNGYDCVCTLPIDAFVFDTLARAAKAKKIPALNAIQTTIPDNIRYTIRGPSLGQLKPEDVDEAKFEDFYCKLSQPAFRPQWMFGTSSKAAKTARNRLMVDSAKRFPFFLYRFFMVDPLSFSFSPWRYQMKLMMASSARYRAAMEMERFAQRELPTGDYALIPLQFYPEASTDYWIPELPVINHYKTVLAVVEDLRKRMPVIIKEHPASIGRRSASFLRKLMATENVWFAPLLYPMGSLVSEAALVIGHGSSTMMQAMCLDRRQLFIGTPYYGAAGRPVLSSLDPAHISGQVERALNDPLPAANVARETLHDMFSRTAPSSLGQYTPLMERSVATVGKPEITPVGRRLLESAHQDLSSSW